MKEKNTKRKYVYYAVEDKARFFFSIQGLKSVECISCSKVVGYTCLSTLEMG
ncbi:hypothetical protein CLU79DRAFT_851603, partial [Phycomyces nitens]